MKKLYAIIISLCVVGSVFAGNPDRQGEAGAAQLLMTPWARLAGFHTLNTSSVSGVEAMRLNVAGLARIDRTELNITHTQYLSGTDISFNAVGLAQRVGKNGVLGLNVMSISFGDINLTTDADPQGVGTTFTPAYYNLGIAYSHIFANKVSVGMLVRGISEGLTNLNAFGLAVDAGVQYVTGPKDNFKLGISLRNVGAPLQFEGEGVTFEVDKPNSGTTIRVRNRVSQFELPSVLNLGLSYDFYLNPRDRLTVLGNFTSNSFSSDDLGGGFELSIRDMFQIRGAYRVALSTNDGSIDTSPLYTGPAAGASLILPLSKEKPNNKVAFDYGYRVTKFFNGTHNIGLRINL